MPFNFVFTPASGAITGTGALTPTMPFTTASGSVTTPGSWTETGGATISTTTMGTITAPAPVWFEATSLTGFDTASGSPYDPQAIDIVYVWTVQGSPIPAFTAPQNMVTGWNNPNVMYGKHVSFAFPSAGTYVVELRCYELTSGKSTPLTGGGVISTTVNVAAPSYSAANTVVFASDGNFTGAPSHDVANRATTISGLQTIINGKTSAGFRLSFKPGDTVANFRLFIDGPLLEYVDTWTAGSIATLDCGFISLSETPGFETGFEAPCTGQIIFRDLKFQGGWNKSYEIGSSRS